MNIPSRFLLPVAALVLAAGLPCFAAEPEVVKLPKPRTEGGMPLMQALQLRRSTREFAADALREQILSDLLWAAFGVNRPESGGRTAPSTHDWQDVDIYLATATGLFRYDARNQALLRLAGQDIRAQTGTQDFVGTAPLNLIYVSDFTRMGQGDSLAEKRNHASIDTGFIGQNVYLYCASQGLATVFRGSVDAEALARTLQLKPTQWVVAAQSVGYPKK